MDDFSERLAAAAPGLERKLADPGLLARIRERAEPENRDGGPGSGNWGHRGRPGHVGGSMPGAGARYRIALEGGGYTSSAQLAEAARRAARELGENPEGGGPAPEGGQNPENGGESGGPDGNPGPDPRRVPRANSDRVLEWMNHRVDYEQMQNELGHARGLRRFFLKLKWKYRMWVEGVYREHMESGNRLAQARADYEMAKKAMNPDFRREQAEAIIEDVCGQAQVMRAQQQVVARAWNAQHPEQTQAVPRDLNRRELLELARRRTRELGYQSGTTLYDVGSVFNDTLARMNSRGGPDAGGNPGAGAGPDGGPPPPDAGSAGTDSADSTGTLRGDAGEPDLTAALADELLKEMYLQGNTLKYVQSWKDGAGKLLRQDMVFSTQDPETDYLLQVSAPLREGDDAAAAMGYESGTFYEPADDPESEVRREWLEHV